VVNSAQDPHLEPLRAPSSTPACQDTRTYATSHRLEPRPIRDVDSELPHSKEDSGAHKSAKIYFGGGATQPLNPEAQAPASAASAEATVNAPA
jgi:hypothetical protein